MTTKKLPWFPFYVADWIQDTRILSLEARAVWMDMLCLMHDSDRRGYLSRHDLPLTPEQLAAHCGCSAAEVTRATRELVDSGVVSCTDHGILYSRRMVRDERKRSLCSQAGKKGGGNPTLKGRPLKVDSEEPLKVDSNPGPLKVDPIFGVPIKVDPKVGPKVPPKVPMVYGYSSGEDNHEVIPEDGGAGGRGAGDGPLKATATVELPAILDTPAFRAAWAEWVQHRREIRKKLTATTAGKQLARLSKLGHDRAVASIEQSLCNGWQGLFEPSTNGAQPKAKTSAGPTAEQRREANRKMLNEQAKLKENALPLPERRQKLANGREAFGLPPRED